MVLDLYWFGGILEGTRDGANPNRGDNSPMGNLVWDERAFPDPTGNTNALRTKYGLGLTMIEEPLIGKNTPTFGLLERSYGLARSSGNIQGDYLNYNPWWGTGGLIDFSSPGSDLWMDCKRCAYMKGCTVRPF